MINERKESIDIDFSVVTNKEELHTLLAESLDFPHFYGKNWDAFWDAITGLVDMPKVLRLKGCDHLKDILPNDARLLFECLDNMQRQYPNWASQVEYIKEKTVEE